MGEMITILRDFLPDLDLSAEALQSFASRRGFAILPFLVALSPRFVDGAKDVTWLCNKRNYVFPVKVLPTPATHADLEELNVSEVV